MIAAVINMFSIQEINKYLNNKNLFSLEILDTVDSTNIYLKKIADNENIPEGKVVISKSQTAGKGRLGRKFYSPSGTGIYMSILLRPDLNASDALFITTAAAVSVAEAVKSVTNVETSIKWVNDIYCYGKKICGILTEASFNNQSNKINYAILGIGINVTNPDNDFPDDIRNIAASIYGTNPCPNDIYNKLIAEILNNFMNYYYNLKEKTFMSEYRKKSMVIGKNVDVNLPNGTSKKAKVLDIDDDAHLLLQYEDKSFDTLSSGEISIIPNGEI